MTLEPYLQQWELALTFCWEPGRQHNCRKQAGITQSGVRGLWAQRTHLLYTGSCCQLRAAVALRDVWSMWSDLVILRTNRNLEYFAKFLNVGKNLKNHCLKLVQAKQNTSVGCIWFTAASQ